MAALGSTSEKRLATCDTRLQHVVRYALTLMPDDFDITVVCGHRGKEAQDKAYASGNSKVRWPDGNHNAEPSKAVDLAPYGDGRILWSDSAGFYLLASYMLAAALHLGINIRWGGHYKSEFWRKKGGDCPHFELKGD